MSSVQTLSRPNDWCLQWEETTHHASAWDKIRHAIAVFIDADDFYEGSDYECDGGVRDTFRSSWTDRRCVERNPDYVDRFRGIPSFISRLAPTDSPLVKMISPGETENAMVWGWGNVEEVEPESSETPAADHSPPPDD